MPKPFPQEFRDDVVRVARNRAPGFTLAQFAKDFGISPAPGVAQGYRCFISQGAGAE